MNREDRCQQPTGDLLIIPPLPPVDMMSLSSIAKKYGYETKFKDYSLKNENVYDFLRDIRVFKPDFLVVNVASTFLEQDLSILTQARELLEDTVVIVKGAIFQSPLFSKFAFHFAKFLTVFREESTRRMDGIQKRLHTDR